MAKKLEIKFLDSEFVNCYSLVKNSDDPSWYFFRTRHKYSLIIDQPIRNKLWKNKFILLEGSSRSIRILLANFCHKELGHLVIFFPYCNVFILSNSNFQIFGSFCVDPSCNTRVVVSENVRAKLKKISNKADSFQFIKPLLSIESLRDSVLWKHVTRSPKGIPLSYPEGFCWLDILKASLRTLYRTYR